MHRRLIQVLALGVLLAAGCGPRGSGGPSDVTLFTGGRLIIGDGSVIEDGALLVTRGRIERVGPSSSITAPPAATVVRLGGKTVIPALIDAHAHLGYEGYTGWGADYYSRDNVVDHLQRYAYYGFGAVFSAGTDPDDLALGLQRDQARGLVDGARLVFAAGMAPPGQGPNDQFLVHALSIARRTDMTVLRGVSTPDEARAAVRQVAAQGIHFVKIWVDDRGGSQAKLQPIVYRAIMAEARTRSLEVVVHQQRAEDMRDLLDSGVSGFLHGRIGPSLDADLAARIHDRGAFLVPNLGLGELRRERVADDPFLQETLPREVINRLGQAYDERSRAGGPSAGSEAAERELREGFMRLVDADVDIVLGTDAGAVPDHFFGYTGHRELEIYVRLGMTPMQALIAGTSRPAERLGLTDMGTLERGKSADFVILGANPLDDIRNTRSIERVFLRGAEVRRAALRQTWTGRDERQATERRGDLREPGRDRAD
jgi:imidazolonepropionase-like amidohydrolase